MPSGAKTDRAQLRRAIAALEAGDVLMVTRLDRLARSTRDLLNTLAAITGRKAGFRSLGDAWADTTTAHGRLMLTVLGGLAEFERDLIRARTGEGRARAKARGRENGPAAQAHPAPAARGDQAPRPGRGIARRHRPQLQRQRRDDFAAGAMSDHERKATAYHEAGHAVMSSIYGRVPISVDIIPDLRGNAGCTHFASDDVPDNFKRHFARSPQKQRYFKMRVLVKIAGTVAHDLMCPERLLHDDGDIRDEQEALALVTKSMSWVDDHDAYLQELKAEAREKLLTNSPKVEAVASMLLRQNKISTSEIQSLLQPIDESAATKTVIANLPTPRSHG